MVLMLKEEDNQPDEDKRKGKVQRVYTRQNPKRHIRLLLWYKMVAVHCFVWPLGLRMWLGSVAGVRQTTFRVLKNLYPVTSKCCFQCCISC